jgi:ion channel-forming bestrophin family protein
MVPYDRRHWLQHLFTVRGSVIPQMALRVLLVTLPSFGVAYANSLGHHLGVPSSVHAVLGTALSLMLAFRTNTAYERFWEGRKAWGAVVNRTRNLARQSYNLIADVELRNRIIVLAVAFVHAMKCHLWQDPPLPELTPLLGEEADALLPPPGPPQRALLAIGELLVQARRAGHLDPIDHHRLEEDVAVLIDQFGVCQRIQRTPIPFAYVVHLRRFLVIFCLTLPLGFVEMLGWVTPSVVLVVAYGLFGIEQIGVEIEDPFEKTPNDLDLRGITAGIENDLMALAGLRATTDATADATADAA